MTTVTEMNIPLVLAHVPALLAYLASDHVREDVYPRRQNACVVLEEYSKIARGEGDFACFHQALEKCKGAAKEPVSLTAKTLLALHDALSKNTPDIARPIADPNDTCDLESWNTERSFIRELFGTQLETKGTKTVKLMFELDVSGNSLAKCVRDHLGDAEVLRAPLVLMCGFKQSKFVDYPYEFVFSGIKYTLTSVATSEKTMYEIPGGWNVPINDVITKDAVVIAYRRV
jgi:hypothetical protein